MHRRWNIGGWVQIGWLILKMSCELTRLRNFFHHVTRRCQFLHPGEERGCCAAPTSDEIISCHRFDQKPTSKPKKEKNINREPEKEGKKFRPTDRPQIFIPRGGGRYRHVPQ